MNGGAFDAGSHEGRRLSVLPSDEGDDPEVTDQMNIPRLCEAHLGFFVLQSAQTSMYPSGASSGVRQEVLPADRCLAVKAARVTASGYALLGLC